MKYTLFFEKRKFTYGYLLLTAAALLSGCAREEKTLLLPESLPNEEKTETADPEKDFSVKKIYAYSYETRELLTKSAFLQGCGENGIHIAAQEEGDLNEKLVYRHVDYRYGFYDTLGEFFGFWEDWFNPAGDETNGNLYIDSLLPSPDGSQMLVYIRSVYDATCLVWLYTCGGSEPWLLYESHQEDYSFPEGSFSPSGRWVTFDVTGETTGSDRIVPIYDCSKDSFVEKEDYWTVSSGKENSSFLYPPDKTLYAANEGAGPLFTAALYDLGDAETPCLLSFTRDQDGAVAASLEYKDSALRKPQSPSGTGAEKDSLLHYLVNEQHNYGENTEDLQRNRLDPPLDTSEDFQNRSFYSYLDLSPKTPYFLYKYMEKTTFVYYMADSFQIRSLEMNMLQAGNTPKQFPEPVWDFLPLDSGDLLVVLVQSWSTTPLEKMSADNETYWTEINSHPDFIRKQLDIQSGDLYLYPADGSEPKLLYKNIQYLLNMEYDSETRRILLETCEEDSPSRRRCIILEL